MAIETAQRLARQGIGATVVDPRWVLPVSDDLVEFAARFHLVVTVEDSGLHGGVGSTLSAALRAADIDIPCRDLGVPQEFLDQGSRDQILRDLGLTAQDIARRITGWVVGLEPNPPAGSRPRSTSRTRADARRVSATSGACATRSLSPAGGSDALPSAAANGPTTSDRCHSRAPPSRRNFSTSSASRGDAGSAVSKLKPSQHNRRSRSGESRFSVGTETDSLTPDNAARAADRRANATGSLRDHRFAGGGPSNGWVTGGRASSGSARARSIADSQTCDDRRCRGPPNTGSARSCSTVVGSAVAAATIAASGSTRPGATSRVVASRSRAIHNSRTVASWRGLRNVWICEVRRHRSGRGGLGARVRMYSNSSAAQSVLPCDASSVAIASRSSSSTSTSRAA